MKKIYLFDLNEDHFEKVANLVLPFYQENPLDFLFIGPTGFYVKQVAETVASKLNRTINRDAFRVINQYVTETLKVYEPNAVILDRDFLKVYIENEITDLIELEKKDEEFFEYLNVISNSNKGVEYLLDIFEKKWEISRVQDEKVLESSQDYRVLENSIDIDSNLYKLYKKLEKKLEDLLSTQFDMSIKYERNYDPVSVYKWFYEIFPKILKEEGKTQIGKRIVISGFFDISPAIYKTFQTMFNLFEEVHFISWTNIEDRAFTSITNIYSFLSNEGFIFEKKHSSLVKVFKGIPITILPMSNDIVEIENVAKEIKRKLIYENFLPEDFGIVVPDTSSAKMLADYFEEINVPFRFKNDVPLSESQTVLILLQPLKTLVRGCEVEDILAMLESGYGGKIDLTMDQIENYLRKFGLLYDIQKTSLKKREEKWMNKIEEEINNRKIYLKNSDEAERIGKELYDLNVLKKGFKKVFEILNDVQIIDRNQQNFTVSSYISLIKKWINNNSINFNKIEDYKGITLVESELNALKTFETLIFNVKNSLEKLLKSNKKLNLNKFYKIISSLIQIETYRETERYANTVEIMSLEDSRFVKKKFKYFISFNEDNYPDIKINPFIASMANEGISLAKLSEEISRRNLFISMMFSDEVILTYSRAKVNGESMISSPYEKEIRKYFKNVHYSESFLLKKDVIPKNPNDIYSKSEALIYYLLNGKREFLPDDYLLNSEKFLEEVNNHKWILESKTQLGRLSHTKISNYVDCPFKYYLQNEAFLKGEKQFEIFFEGLIKHRVLKEIFDKYKEYRIVDQKLLDEEGFKEEIKNIVYDLWDRYIDESFYSYKVIKEITAEEIVEDIYYTISTMHKDYIKIGKKKILNYSQVLETELEVKVKIDLEKYKDIDLETRIDRIDLSNGNYMFLMDTFEDDLYEGVPVIIDYKNSKSVQSEQLLIYYLALLNIEEWKNRLQNKDIYLKFQITKRDENRNKFIKIQKDKIIYNMHGKSAKYISFDFKEFTDWMQKILTNIENSNFTPISVKERGIKRFFEEMYEKYGNAKSDETYYDCQKCDFKSLCTLLEYKKDFKIERKNYYPF